jgi:transposase InsO family protein
MRQAGLQGTHRRRRPVTTVPDAGAHARPDLINRQFTPDAGALNQRWCGDITYIPTDEGWLYLATVREVCRGTTSGLDDGDDGAVAHEVVAGTALDSAGGRETVLARDLQGTDQ